MVWCSLGGGVRKARLEVLERIAEALDEPLWRLFADGRLTVDEKRWQGESSRLGEVVSELPVEDVRALLGVAQRLAVRRREPRDRGR